ncbi:unnamed protein product [Pedinophyceae sp. YPF-701]|nr:unnamed protein product [Pedinophyceae sp. YPF-701]
MASACLSAQARQRLMSAPSSTPRCHRGTAPRAAARREASAPRSPAAGGAIRAPAGPRAGAAERPGRGSVAAHSLASARPRLAKPDPPPFRQFDFLVLGSGIAGLTYALEAAEHGTVALVSKGALQEGCTQYAQGGICAVLDAHDSPESHIRDTMAAGAGLCHAAAVEAVCREGPRRVLELVARGASFTKNPDGSLHLTREGGHSHRRIVHAADATGAEIMRALLAAVRAHANISVFADHHALDLYVDEVDGTRACLGADVLDRRHNAVTRFLAYSTMVASGGAGQLYPATTNPSTITGDGIAMAFRAGAAVTNMECVQFHPTGLGVAREHGGSRFLVSEAVRGEGGVLYNSDNERFMLGEHELAELAPRDVVARAIAAQMEERGEPHMWLDISHKPRDFILSHFPNIAAHCLSVGIDITQEPMPVCPTQHYLCGGIHTGLLGETAIPGLYACGEAACTGLHGANRLASNSLLEGLVFAHRAVEPSAAHAEWAARRGGAAMREGRRSAAALPRPEGRLRSAERRWLAEVRADVQRAMWEGAGITRTPQGLVRALRQLDEIAARLDTAAQGMHPNLALSEVQNLVTVGRLVVFAALQRRESRGGHSIVGKPRSDGERWSRAWTVTGADAAEAARARRYTLRAAPVEGWLHDLPAQKAPAKREPVATPAESGVAVAPVRQLVARAGVAAARAAAPDAPRRRRAAQELRRRVRRGEVRRRARDHVRRPASRTAHTASVTGATHRSLREDGGVVGGAPR